jgi:NTP pyrophosphatase (non-canonical NTP hydrolase)
VQANEYQVLTRRTATNTGDPEKDLLINALGLSTEASEAADVVKKEVGHGHDRKMRKVMEEIGDTFYYAARVADEYGFTLEDAMIYNIEKLKKRYPNGFTYEDSIKRIDTLE